MSTSGNMPVRVYATAGIQADVEIEARLAPGGMEAVEIRLGHGPELIIDCADVESLERLRDAAASGARLLHERIEKNLSATAREQAGDPGRLGEGGDQ